MRISDDERRAVAAKMRETCRENPDVSLQGMVASTMNECLPEGMEYGPTLADLIDRPTCHLIEDQDGRTACSECGCTALYLSDATYCPDCGGVITDD
jgi:hypothetical protein